MKLGTVLICYIYVLTCCSRPVLSQPKHHIGLCITATHKYVNFAKQLVNSAEKYFFPEKTKTYFIFTDQIDEFKNTPNITAIFWDHRPWPLSTMQRFEAYYRNKNFFKNCHYIFACDADMLFVQEMGSEILEDLVATLHPGFLHNPNKPYEQDRRSAAHVIQTADRKYFAGGFYGGSANSFINLIKNCYQNVNKDLANNFIARWHDESHLNKYFSQHPPTKILPSSYCHPENWTAYTPPKILALLKEHKHIRDDFSK